MASSESKRSRALICLVLALATVGIYCRTAGFDFVNFDDPYYVTDNAMIRAGITFKGIVWAFTHSYSGNWHPLTWISLMLDCQLFGVSAEASHLINVALHTVDAVLLFLLLHSLTGAQWRSAIIAALFALHPLHVESVAWISERKDVLSTLFCLLTLMAYTRYVEKSKTQSPKPQLWHVLALVLFALGLMAKPMLVTLPFLLLLLDFWPLQRVENTGWRTFLAPQFGQLVGEKWAWFAFSAASCVITFSAQKTGGAIATLKNLPFSSRVVVATESYCWYVQKLFWPVRLAILYPLHLHRPLLPFVGACLFLLLISAVAVFMAKQRPYFLVGWLWFVGMLVPVIGFVQVGTQATADRYSYLPSIGLFVVIVWWVYELIRDSSFKLVLGSCAAVVVLAILSVAAFVQTSYWQNSLTLFSHTTDVTSANDRALNGLGLALYENRRYDDALAVYDSALRINPSADTYKNIGLALDKKGRFAEALRAYEHAAQLEPQNAPVQYWLATELATLGRKDDALAHYKTAVDLDPESAIYQNDLGAVLAAVGRKADALPCYEIAARLEPSNARYQDNFATALARAGQTDAAIQHYQAAIGDDTNFADAYSNLGALLASEQRLEEAARDYSQALRLDPTNATIHLNAGLVFLKLGRSDESMAEFAEAVRLNSNLADARYELGRQLLSREQYQPAREQLEQAVELKPDYASAHFYLGLTCLKLHLQEQGLQHIQEAARLQPGWAEPLNLEAWILATSPDEKIRNGPESVRIAEHAAALASRQQPVILRTLAAAYAEAGHFEQAVTTANQALQSAQGLGQTTLTAEIQRELELYQARRPFRDTADDKK